MQIPSILEEIIKKKEKDLEHEKYNMPLTEIIQKAEKKMFESYDKPSFAKALRKNGLSIIGEIKKASPSKGIIKEDFNHMQLAMEYEKCVEAISVLTEKNYFLGDNKYLREVSDRAVIPTLRKDFIIDDYQIYEAKVLGASSVLLIVALLNEQKLKRYISLCSDLELDALVEVHNSRGVEIALKSGAKIIGINNRDLHSFKVDVNTTNLLVEDIPSSIIIVSESGIKGKEDIEKINKEKVDAILVGESFMRAKDMIAKGKELRDAFNS